MAEISEKSKSVLDYIKRAELTPTEVGEVIGGLTMMVLGDAVGDAMKDLLK